MIPSLNGATAGGGLALPDYVALAARHGFAGVEFDIRAAQALGFTAAAALFESHSVFPSAFGLPVEWRKDDETFREGLKELPALAKLAQDLNATRCTTWVLPDGGHDVSAYATTSVARFTRIAEVLAENGVRFALEFIGPSHFRTHPANVWFYDIAGGLAVADEINHVTGVGNVGLLVDSFHWHTSGATAMDLASIPLEQIVHVHINDAPAGLERDQIIDSVRELPGATGTIDLVGFLTTLAGIGYDGPVAVEVFSEALRAMTPDEAAKLAAASLDSVFAQAKILPVHPH